MPDATSDRVGGTLSRLGIVLLVIIVTLVIIVYCKKKGGRPEQSLTSSIATSAAAVIPVTFPVDATSPIPTGNRPEIPPPGPTLYAAIRDGYILGPTRPTRSKAQTNYNDTGYLSFDDLGNEYATIDYQTMDAVFPHVSYV